VLDLLAALEEVGGRTLAPRFEPERPGEVRRSCLDVTRARTELGWAPRVELRDGLRTILAGL
jgi:UDP-glucose 4-epimerase